MGCGQMDLSSPNRFAIDESLRVPTCYVKLNLQCDFAGDAGVPQQLIGLLQRAVLSGDAVYWQDAVADLQDAAPVHREQI